MEWLAISENSGVILLSLNRFYLSAFDGTIYWLPVVETDIPERVLDDIRLDWGERLTELSKG